MVEKSRDIQLDRAEDLLKGVLLYDAMTAPEKVAANKPAPASGLMCSCLIDVTNDHSRHRDFL